MSDGTAARAIADEYLRDDKPTLYKSNALTLLRVLGGPDSACRIAEEAMGNPDGLVRERAVRELKDLKPEDRPIALKRLREGIAAHPGLLRSLRAYMALAATGEPVGRIASWPRRVRLEFYLHRETCPNKGLRFHVRVLVPALAGTIAGAVAVLLYLMGLGVLPAFAPDVPSVIVLTSVLAALTAPVLTMRSIPFALHVDRVGGILAECLWILPLHLCVFAFLYLITSLGSSNTAVSVGGLAYSWMTSAATVVVARLASIVLDLRSDGGKWTAPLAAAAAGALGALVLTGLTLLHETRPIAAWWATVVPVTFGLAAAFVAIDLGGPPARCPLGVLRAGAACAAIAGLVLLMASPFRGKSRDFARLPGEQPSIAIKRLPEVLHFSVAETTSAYVSLRVARPSNDFIDWIWQSADREPIYSTLQSMPPSPQPSYYSPSYAGYGYAGATPMSIWREVSRGEYSVAVRRRSQPTSEQGVFDAVFDVISHRAPVPGLQAELFIAQKRPAQPDIPKASAMIDTAVDHVPFRAAIRVPKEKPFLYVGFSTAGKWFDPPFTFNMFRETGRSRVEYWDEALAPDNYVILVDQLPRLYGNPASGFREPPPPPDTESVPKGWRLTAMAFLPGRMPAGTELSGARQLHAYWIKSLPLRHPFRIAEPRREVAIQAVLSGPDRQNYDLHLLNSEGNTTMLGNPMGTGPMTIRTTLDAGEYFIEVSLRYGAPERGGGLNFAYLTIY